MVRIAGSHPAGPGSIPGGGRNLFVCYSWCHTNLPDHTRVSLGASFVRNPISTVLFNSGIDTFPENSSTRMGFEPTRAEHIGLAVQRLNHSATSSFREKLEEHAMESNQQLKWFCAAIGLEKYFPMPGIEPGPPG